ncbi:MAG: SlyX family protein [Bdellovibrionales bacterium]|nr:SlyX family protein [Bdellovibrionales bacterium]
MNEQRLIDLETKVSYQEVLVEELRQTVHEQYLAIEKLEKSLKVMTDRIRQADASTLAVVNEKPPHY